MRSPGINGEGELRGQPANPSSPGKMAVKTECVCVLCTKNADILFDVYSAWHAELTETADAITSDGISKCKLVLDYHHSG